MLQVILTALAVIGLVFIIYCYETAQLVDESFQPLEPEKNLKDAETTKVILFIIIFFIIESIINHFLYPTCTLF